ncbi:MAG TPA: PD-(D/E)XK nuclease family protein, partial [Phycisphaeraceae bacterium]
DQVEQAVARRLEQMGRVDVHTARQRALEEGRCAAPGPIVLVGLADQSRLLQRFLRAIDGPVASLIAAPQEEADAFDEMGGLIVDAWADRALEVREDQWHVADRPRDQAYKVLEAIAQATAARPLGPEAITVGLGDEQLAPTVERVLSLAGVPVRMARGQALLQTRPALLLAAIGRYLRSRRFDALAALLRHPDVPVRGQGVEDWLSLLDRYATDHLQGRVTGAWLGPMAPRLKRVYEAVHALLPTDADRSRPLPQWAESIGRLLARIYGGKPLRRFDDQDARLIAALEHLRDRLAQLARLDEGPYVPRAPLHGAIELLLEQLAGVALPGGEAGPAVELVGFLELPLDDAPVVVLTGVNEGAVPSSVGADALLPGQLRQALGLGDNRRRLARDLYAMTLVLRCRADAVLISGRRTAEGDPLTPSRLLLRCGPETAARRLQRFYDDEEKAASPAPLLLTPGVMEGASRFVIPPPLMPVTPITSLRVTAFRDYLACPYRFYLRHILRLEGLDDEAVEMSGSLFGTIAHRVLRAFGCSDLIRDDRAEAIADFLGQALEREMRERFGKEPGAAVMLQGQQLRERLNAFARWQAQQAREGWRIVPERVERRCEAVLQVDGEPFTITGDIDRIDEHPEHGYRVIDYKTYDQASVPAQTHRVGRGDQQRWVDLQLPLYRELARATGCDGRIELGYVLLPRSVADVGWAEAGWGEAEIDEAVEQARQVIRAVREGRFWPPGDVPEYADEFSGVCLDRVMDREAAIAGAEALAKVRRGGAGIGPSLSGSAGGAVGIGRASGGESGRG